MYQVSDSFTFDDSTGIKAGVTGWSNQVNSVNVIVPITQDFGDIGDSGLLSTSVVTNGNGRGIRELYTGKVVSGSGTRLDFATTHLEGLIGDNTDSNSDGVTNNGRRTAVPQIAVILTDASSTQLSNAGNGGGSAWTSAAALLRAAGPSGVEVVVMLIDVAATAYNNDAGVRATVNGVAGGSANVFIGATYADISNPANGFISGLVTKVCDTAQASATQFTVKTAVVNDNSGSSNVSAFNVNSNAGALAFNGGATVGNTTTFTSS